MGLDDIVKKAKDAVGDAVETVKEKAPGVIDTIKDEAGELKKIATGDGSLSEKAKAAVNTVKNHGDDAG